MIPKFFGIFVFHACTFNYNFDDKHKWIPSGIIPYNHANTQNKLSCNIIIPQDISV